MTDLTDLEGRLRTEMDAFAQRANPDVVRPLRPPPGRAERQAPRRKRRWLAPAAAAAAVAAVIAAVTVAVRSGGYRQPAETGLLPVPAIPPYYLVLSAFPSGHQWPAVLRSTATGEVLASTRAMPLTNGSSTMVTGSLDGRTFVVLDNAAVPDKTSLYRVRVAPDGRSLRVDRLPISTYPMEVHSVALSPDGSQLAIAERSCPGNRCQFAQIQVRSLATGAIRNWRTQADGGPWELSWSADGRHIGFLWLSTRKPPVPRPEYRQVDVTGQGDDLLAGTAVRMPPDSVRALTSPVVTPDGRAYVTANVKLVRGRDHRGTVTARIIKISARTGKLQRVLYTKSASDVLQAGGRTGPIDYQDCRVVGLDRTGQHPLVQCSALGRISFGIVAGGHLRRLPYPNTSCIAECRGPTWAAAAW